MSVSCTETGASGTASAPLTTTRLSRPPSMVTNAGGSWVVGGEEGSARGRDSLWAGASTPTSRFASLTAKTVSSAASSTARITAPPTRIGLPPLLALHSLSDGDQVGNAHSPGKTDVSGGTASLYSSDLLVSLLTAAPIPSRCGNSRCFLVGCVTAGG